MTRYETVNTRTAEGLKQAERLKAYGWKIVSVGFWTITFEKTIPDRNGGNHVTASQ